MLLRNTFRAFRHRDYFIFWCGLFLGHTGTLVQATAQSWLIFQLTNSPFYLGLEGLCLGLPRVIFSPLGGAIVDRTDRKTLFVVTQTAFLLMALFLGVMDYLGMIRVWHVLTVSALTGFFVATIGNLIVLLTIFMIHIAAKAPPTNQTTASHDMAEGLAYLHSLLIRR